MKSSRTSRPLSFSVSMYTCRRMSPCPLPGVPAKWAIFLCPKPIRYSTAVRAPNLSSLATLENGPARDSTIITGTPWLCRKSSRLGANSASIINPSHCLCRRNSSLSRFWLLVVARSSWTTTMLYPISAVLSSIPLTNRPNTGTSRTGTTTPIAKLLPLRRADARKLYL